MPVAPVRIGGSAQGPFFDTYAVLDSASEENLINRSLADEIGVFGEVLRTSVISATGTVTVSLTQRVNLFLKGYRTDFSHAIEALAIPHMTDLSDHIPSPKDISRNPHLRGIHIPVHPRRKVDLIIGIAESRMHFTHRSRVGAPNQLWASLTGLGWVLHGRDSNSGEIKELDSRVNVSHFEKTPENVSFVGEEDELLHLVRRGFHLDFNEAQYGLPSKMSRNDLKMLAKQRETVNFINGRYEIGLLWKTDPRSLPNNFVMAKRCLDHLGSRLLANPDLLEKYNDFIQGLFDNNQAELAPFLSGHGFVFWYLVHHPVLKKFRVVFNGAANFGGKSLNACLDKGPEHSSTLLGTLLRFRTFQFAITADIKGMFYNISLIESDRDFLRFLWWENGDPRQRIVEYRLTHQAPGLTSSPSNACFVLRQIAIDNRTNASPITLHSIRTSFYMDDWLPSFSSISEARTAVDEIRTLLTSAGLHLTKFVSNNAGIIENVPAVDRAPVDETRSPGTKEERKTLGIWWDADTDVLRIGVSLPTRAVTRRTVLSAIMSPFDPCGIVSPFLLDMRLLLQRLFKLALDWDTPIPTNERTLWLDWVQSLPQLEKITCPRVLIPRPNFDNVYLCTFCDASVKGYAAVSYIVCQYGETHSVSFALGKVRVAPGKTNLSIPRLELLGAVLAVEMARSIQTEMEVNFDTVYFWTDSLTVLHYILNPNLKLKLFVANRVAKILELSNDALWSHIRTNDNPSDLGSRGLKPGNPESVRPWLEGPAFLRQAKRFWPLTNGSGEVQPAPADLEIKVNVASIPALSPTAIETLDTLFQKYSTLDRLQTCTAWLLRYRAYLSGKLSPLDFLARITVPELADALISLIRAAQWTVFPHLMAAFHDPPIRRCSSLLYPRCRCS